MKTNSLIVVILGLTITAFLLGACAPVNLSPAQTPVAAPVQETPLPEPPLPTFPESERQALAEKLGVDLANLVIHSIDAVEWPDACLGLPGPDEMCAEVITPGFGGILISEDQQYEFRMDEKLHEIRLIPGAALSARQVLAQRQGLEFADIRFVLIEDREWPDACLGIDSPGQLCAQVITPGYKIVLREGQNQYVFHTDKYGGTVILASAPQADTSNAVITWTQTSDSGCKTASFSPIGVFVGDCGRAMIEGKYNVETRLAELGEFYSKYAPFQAETKAGIVNFLGKGIITATPEEQRMIGEWARLAALEAEAGRSGASWGLAYTWHREGGIAGFCDDVTFFVSGEAVYTSCIPNWRAKPVTFRLTSNQLRQMYSWIDSLAGFEDEKSDPGTADQMTHRIYFSGTGTAQVRAEEIQAMQELASEMVIRASLQGDIQEMEPARAVLLAYYNHLGKGEYGEAAALFYGELDSLAYFNPDLNADDAAILFEAACTVNGFICLEVLNIVHEIQLTGSDFRFTVEFKDPYGELFEFGPCCGADPEQEPPQTQFDVLVKEIDGEFRVLDLPMYVP